MTQIPPAQPLEYTNEELQGLIGKHLLVGIAHCDIKGEVVSREQFHGIVNRVSHENGVTIKLNGSGDERTVPLQIESLHIARVGDYHLTGSNEIIEDPDYTLQMNIYPAGYKA